MSDHSDADTPDAVRPAPEDPAAQPGRSDAAPESANDSAAPEQGSDDAQAPTPDAADSAEDAEPASDAEPVDPDTTDPDDQLADVVELVPDETVRLRERVAALEAQLRTVSAAWKEKETDLANARDRLKRQATLREELRRGEVVAELFDPVENLRRSLDAVSKVEGAEDARSGLEMVLNQFMTAFSKLGLEEVPGKGAAFDPNLHEALTAMPVTDPALDNVVIEVFASGYRIGSRLIRPARVVIGQLAETPDDGIAEA